MISHVNLTDSKISWIGKFPQHWSLKRINDLATVSYGHPFDSAKFNADIGTPLVRIRDISSNSTDIRFDGDVPNYSLIGNGDILVGMDGDFNTAWWQGGTAALNQRVALVRATDEITQRFIYYALPFNLKVINDITFYTTVKHLSGEDIKKTLISIPHDGERKAVVSYLDAETARIDSLISEKRNFIDLLKEKRQALISHFVTKGLDANVPMKDSGVEWIGGVPEHWGVPKIAYIYPALGSGTTPKSDNEDYYGGNTPWVTTGELRESEIRETKKTVSDLALAEHSALKIHQPDSVVMAMYGATIGRVGILKIEATTNQACCVFPPSPKMLSGFLYYWLMGYREEIVNLGYGGGQPNISMGTVSSLKIPTPSISEQETILERIEQETSTINELLSETEKSIGLLKEHRTALISAAVTGKIDVRGMVDTKEGAA